MDEIIIAPKSKVHGDELIIFYIDYIKSFLCDYNNLSFVEIGSERGTGSSHRLAKLCKKNGWKFVTVDPDEGVSAGAKEIVKKIDAEFEAIKELGEVYLQNHSGKDIGVCYLDAFDIVTDWPHKQSSVETYKKRNVEITNEAAYKMHYDASVNVCTKIVHGGFVCFDDVWLDKSNVWQGKGKTAIPFLLSNGYKIVSYKDNSLLLQNILGFTKEQLDKSNELLSKINLNQAILFNRIKRAPKKILKKIGFSK